MRAKRYDGLFRLGCFQNSQQELLLRYVNCKRIYALYRELQDSLINFTHLYESIDIEEHEKELLKYAKEKFSKYEKVKIYSPENPEVAGGILSFTIQGIHPHDIASIFNEEEVSIRSGQHCAEPLMKKLGIPATARMSFYLYNSKEDVDKAEIALQKTLEIFK